MSSNQWPHQFTHDGREYEIGSTGGSIKDQEHLEIEHKILARPMICVHCHKKYIQNIDPYPAESCPARSDKRELKRIKSL